MAFGSISVNKKENVKHETEFSLETKTKHEKKNPYALNLNTIVLREKKIKLEIIDDRKKKSHIHRVQKKVNFFFVTIV